MSAVVLHEVLFRELAAKRVAFRRRVVTIIHFVRSQRTAPPVETLQADLVNYQVIVPLPSAYSLTHYSNVACNARIA